MLGYIAVKNIAVIDKLSLEFEKGLNVITGETGAGKSVLIGALKYLTGDRLGRLSARDIASHGGKYSAEGVFSLVENISEELKDQYEIDDEVIIFRETDENSRNKAFINGRAAPVNRLRDLSEYLIDIHGQHENQLLFNPAKHLTFIDYFVEENLLHSYAQAYRNFRSKNEELERFKSDIAKSDRLIEIYKYQLEEISKLNIDLEKDVNINERVKLMSSLEKVREAVSSSLNFLNNDEISATELITNAIRALSPIENISTDIQKAKDSLESALSSIEDASAYIEGLIDEEESFSTDDLNALIDRKYKLEDIIAKYGEGSNEVALKNVLKKKEELEEYLSNLESKDDLLNKLEREREVLYKACEDVASELNLKRREAADMIASRVEKSLGELELNNSKFEVKFFKQDSLDSSGGIKCEFYISTNKGFLPGPLATIASGGEISRVMLALKEVFADFDEVGTMIFDEIDTGISGKAAYSVAKKLKTLSRKKQIIVITHLPVVAALGDVHFHVSKDEVDGKTATNIKLLDEKRRLEVLAMMTSGEVTELSLKQAEELVNRGVE